MAGLPKKYARMGFKKGWKAFKNSKSNSTRATPKRKVRRASAQRTVAKRSRKVAKRKRSSKKASSMKPVTARVVGGFAYGLLRQPLSDLARKLPLVGGVGDEIVLGAVMAFARSRLSGTAKQIADAGLTIEASRLGASAGSGALGSIFKGASQPNGAQEQIKNNTVVIG